MSNEPLLFRPSKKRKVYRQRATSEGIDRPPTSPEAAAQAQSLDELISAASTAPAAEDDGDGISMAEILRLRHGNRKRGGGVEFKALSVQATQEQETSVALIAREDDGTKAPTEELAAVTGGLRKFAPQSGVVGDVNRHMMEYIDSELAKRSLSAKQSASNPGTSTSAITTFIRQPSSSNDSKAEQVRERQPATIGRLQEVDLGPDSTISNIHLTNAALSHPTLEPAPPPKSQKGRLRPDGTPFRRKKRRASEDIARDALVEKILSENRLEHYEAPPPPKVDANEEDGAADDRIAEAFRREFMDAVSQRQRKKQVVAPPPRGAQAKKEEEMLKGPKLGGSRSARAAMRDSLLKSARK